MFGLAATAGAIYSLWQGVLIRRKTNAELAKPISHFTPPASVIVPCRGLEPHLEENLASVVSQDYPDFEVLFVVDDEDDEAVEVIKRVCRTPSDRLIVVDRKGNASGKALAIISAAASARKASRVLAFADSDGRVSANWLRSLVGPLENAEVGASTGFRWYLDSGSIVSKIVSVWNAAGTNIMFDDRYNFVWGGSWTIRRQLYDELKIPERMANHFSDDQVVTQAVREAELRIQFVSRSMAKSAASARFRRLRDFIEWAILQVAITRIYNQPLWRYAAFSYSSYNTITVLGFLALAFSLVYSDSWSGMLGAVLLLHLPLGFARADLRWRTLREAMSNHQERLSGRFGHALASLSISWIMMYAIIESRKKQTFTWRGRTYMLDRQGQVLSVT